MAEVLSKIAPRDWVWFAVLLIGVGAAWGDNKTAVAVLKERMNGFEANYERDSGRMLEALKRIEDKLDRKADK